MRILLTNHHFQYYGGSETATLALYQALTKKGYQVDVWSHEKSISGICEEVPTFVEHFNDTSRHHYDLALVNHNSCLNIVSEKELAKTVIFTSHGPFGGLEEPRPGADLYCAVSEEVRDAYPQYDMKIVRNGVNLDRFFQRSELSNTLKTVLLLSNRTTKEGIELIKSVCEEVGAKFRHVGLHAKFTPKIEDEIDKADIVVTVGRGVLEAAAMNKGVLIWDYRPYNGQAMGDGVFTDKNALLSMQYNYSGRARKFNFSKEQLVNAFKSYKPSNNRSFVEKYHDINKIADKYIQLAQNASIKATKGKKKILILAGLTYYHRSYSLAGIIKTQAKTFVENGHKTTLVVSKNMSRVDQMEETGATIYQLISDEENTLDDLREVVSQHDVVITHDFAWLDYYEWLDKVCDQLENDYPNVQFIHQIHSSPGLETAPEWKIGRNKPNVLYSHPGKQLRGIVARHLQVPDNKVVQLQYTNDFIDASGGDENLYHELDLIDQDIVGFFPAHPLPGKNIPAILHIVKSIKDLGKKIKYVFTVNGVRGGRTRVDDYKDLAKKLGIEENIIWLMDIPKFRGVVEYDTVQAIWKRTNLFIHPSLSEANPLILLEAMAHGCLLLLNKDFERFMEMAGASSTDAIYHPFGSHLKGNQTIDQSDKGYAQIAAKAVVERFDQSFGFTAKNRAFQKFNRQKIYQEFMDFLEGTQMSVPLDKPKVSVIIPILNTTPLKDKTPELIQMTKDCIKSVGEAEIIVINNNPDDHETYAAIQVNNPYNYGVSRAWNQGIVRSTGDYILILNSDVILSPNWLEEMVKYADQGLVFPWYQEHQYGEGEIPQEQAGFPQIQGSCFMAHKSIFRKIGPFDQERYFAYAEDQDYWKRAKENNVKFFRANTTISHKMNATSSKITADTIYNDEQIKKHGKDQIFSKIFNASNLAYEDWWGERVKGI